MTEPFRPRITPDPSLASPTEATMGDVLNEGEYADLYHLAQAEGLPYFARLNGAGDVELYLVFESIDAFSEATRDAVSIEFKTYRQKLLAVIWTLSDPQEPLGFPLAFDIGKAEDRFMALRMLEQEHTPIHYLGFHDGNLIHIYSEAVTFSHRERERGEELIRRLFEGEWETEAEPAAEEVKEAEIATVPADVLSDTILREKGTAYHFAFDRMRERYGEEEAQHLLMSTLHQAMLVIRRHARSEVRESRFTIWAGEKEKSLLLMVTPDLSSLFEVIHMSADEANPFSRFLLALPDYRETTEEAPLAVGAYPILRYEAGQLFHLELSEATQERLARLYEAEAGNQEKANPYR
ncbi:hypothetical protein G3578_09560 [Brevibacillus sp. SYP-B805]|uniref:hypothetical protein n=1 Tax=Brevibacillus sp. SYP-B805 TaxID=1578199 RepID=UPI0013EC7960|nr:hypothetical protein [Brevibacillus sp. SYP-B805]NGQ95401.1 hypothetical protein [Brevibacillus sp. SYP-B805]